MLRLSLLFSVLYLATAACSGRQPKLPADLDPLAQQCYREVLKVIEKGAPQVEAPTSMEDGTYLIQWRLSETDFGSCQVDGSGALMMLTRNQPAAPEASPPQNQPNPVESQPPTVEPQPNPSQDNA